MRTGIRKFLIDAAVGLVIAIGVTSLQGVWTAQTASDVLRCVSDGLFVAGALLIAAGGLQWTYNGGAFDGLTFAFKTGVARIRRDFEKSHMHFSEYQQQREAKASSPRYLLLSGACYFALAVIAFAAYSRC